jgi:hypothetical protein
MLRTSLPKMESKVFEFLFEKAKDEYGAEDDTQAFDIEEAKVENGAEDVTIDCVLSIASAEFDSVEENNAIRRTKYDKKRTSAVTAF